MSDPWDRLARFRLELTNSVGQGPYLKAIKRADVTLEQPLTSGIRPHFLIVAASDHDAAVFRGEAAWEWIKRCSQDAGLSVDVVIAVAEHRVVGYGFSTEPEFIGDWTTDLDKLVADIDLCRGPTEEEELAAPVDADFHQYDWIYIERPSAGGPVRVAFDGESNDLPSTTAYLAELGGDLGERFP